MNGRGERPSGERRSLESDLARLDTLIHQPKRLAILAALESRGEVEFVTLRRITGITDGNLSTHLQRLEAAGLVRLEKRFLMRKPLTTARLTSQGDAAIEAFLVGSSRIVEQWKRKREEAAPPEMRPGKSSGSPS